MAMPQFSGETPFDAVVHYNSLDIEEEEEFRTYLLAEEVDIEHATVEALEAAYIFWREGE